jgi:hypothetical protein
VAANGKARLARSATSRVAIAARDGISTVRSMSAPTQPADDVQAPDGADWLTIDDISAVVHLTRDTLYKWSSRGYPYWPRDAVKLPNGSWRCRRSDLDAWLLTQPWQPGAGR